MLIRLSKASKDLNIGMSTAIEYLRSLGHNLAIDPNLKLSDELYLILAERFSKDMAQKIVAEKITLERQVKAQQIQNEPLNTINSNINTYGSGIQRTQIDKSPIEIDSIDLNLLMQNTRPKPKTKEQKRKEREEKNSSLSFSKRLIENDVDYLTLPFLSSKLIEPTDQKIKSRVRYTNQKVDINRIDLPLFNEIESTNTATKSNLVDFERFNKNSKEPHASYDNNLKEIWVKFTDVQEQMIRLRSFPISVIPDSVKISGEKLYLTANEVDITDKIIKDIASTFDLPTNEINKEDGYFYVDIEKSQTIKQEVKNQLSEKSSVNFVNFSPLPVIDGIIKTLKIEIKISIAPNPVFFLKNKYPEYSFKHKTLFVNKVRDSLKSVVRIKSEEEINDKLFTFLNETIGLRKDFKVPKTYSYDFRKYIDKLSNNENELFTYNQEDFFNQFISICQKNNLHVRLESKDAIISIDPLENVEDIIYDLLKVNNEVFFYNYSSFNGDSKINEAENLLREKFPSIKTRKDDKKGTLYFFQEYQNSEQSIKIKQILEAELSDLQISNPNVFNSELFDIPTNKEKYIIEINKQSKRESQASAVKELRKSDFWVNKNYFGKLFQVNYPELIFDISGNEFEKTKQLFESHIISSIEPNLTGDLEKVYRLKNSLSNILNGTNLQNPNLNDFIFDAEKAKKIEDIDIYTNSQSEIFKELEYHLLNKKINESQKQAIIKTLLAEDLALIQGPPGTGKSTAIAEIIWQHIRKNPKERILLTSETNLAVDNAIDRIVNDNHNLVKPIRFGDEEKLEMEGRQFSVEVMKRWVQDGRVDINLEEKAEDEELTTQKLILLNWIDNIKNRANDSIDLDDKTRNLWLEILSDPTQDIRQIFYDNYIQNCNLIGATCSSIGERNTKNNPTSFFKNYCEIFGSISKEINRNDVEYFNYRGKIRFSTIIQDESSKATPAELSLPLIYGKKNIIIGDHRQLPPMLDKEEFRLSLDFLLDKTENEDEKNKIKKLKSFVLNKFNEMEISHFERLFDKIDSSLKGIFNKQYRMHPDINDVIKQFYINDGGLECGLINPIDLGVNDPDIIKNTASRYHGIEIEGLISKNNHVIWIDTNTPELLDGTSRINYGEVDAIRGVLTKFRNSDSFKRYQSFWSNPEDQQIGIISFYGKQIKLLNNLRNEFKDLPIRVSTVDRFQGMERNIIIVSMVRSSRIASDKNQKVDLNLYGELGFPEQKDLGFAQSPNRLNVALSRAKRLLIIVGNSELFKQKEIYDNVYQTIASNPNGRIIKYETL
jgi:superfamily I DNA and/or RNA helicase